MKYEIIKDFPGSQDGRTTEQFIAGTQAELSAYLADIAMREGWARPVNEVEIDNKAVITDSPRRGKAK